MTDGSANVGLVADARVQDGKTTAGKRSLPRLIHRLGARLAEQQSPPGRGNAVWMRLK